MKTRLIGALVGVIMAASVVGEENQQVLSGVYATQVYDIDFVQEQYEVQFWMWFLHHDQAYEPWERTEITNAKSFDVVAHTRERIGEQFFDSIKISAVVRGSWDLTYYPFDLQRLIIEIEDNQQTVESLRFIVDDRHSGLDESALPHGWQLLATQISSTDNQYRTTFGDPRLGENEKPRFSQVNIAYRLEREGGRLFITLFLGFFIAWLLTLLVLVGNCSQKISAVVGMDELNNISIGALFATVASIYTLSDSLPYTTELVLADHIQIITLISVVLAIAMTIWTQVDLHHNQQSQAEIEKYQRVRFGKNRLVTLVCLLLAIADFAYFFSRH